MNMENIVVLEKRDRNGDVTYSVANKTGLMTKDFDASDDINIIGRKGIDLGGKKAGKTRLTEKKGSKNQSSKPGSSKG